MSRFLLGVRACNEYWQQVALALYESRALESYRTGWTVPPFLRDTFPTRWARSVPSSVVSETPSWDLLRLAAVRAGAGARVEDWIFDRGEKQFDRSCARRLEEKRFDRFLGVEYGSLESLRAARRLGKAGVVAFVSVHHKFREKWVDPVLQSTPGLLGAAKKELLVLASERDRRRDQEAETASLILSCSDLITRTLVEAGFPAEKIVTVPLGAPPAIAEKDLPQRPSDRPRFVFAGQVAPHKGILVLLEAWKKLKNTASAELHLYGNVSLPRPFIEGLPETVHIHGAVSQPQLQEAFREGHALVFPTLCDGFGAVVTEALAQGLPVITTRNAGAAMLIEDRRNGLIVAPGEEQPLLRALEESLDDPKRWFAMKRAALSTARAAGWPEFRQTLRQKLAKTSLSTSPGRERICIVTPDSVSSTPRVVKEADALSAAGYQVRVVCSQGVVDYVRSFDAELHQGKTWRLDALGWSARRAKERWRYWKSGLRQRLLQRLPRWFWRFPSVVDRAEGRLLPELAACAAAEPADLYIGHYPTGLAAAARAAARHRALLRYDAEDLHVAEYPTGASEDARAARIRRIEGFYLPRVSAVTAASPLIGVELERRYALPPVVTVLNAFPWAEREKLDQTLARRPGPLRAYWFSQTIGADRGVEDAVRAAAVLGEEIELHLQGQVSEVEKERLLGLVQPERLRAHIFFHEPIPPTELLAFAAQFDLGLALETPRSLNRQIAVSNKIFIYMQAGLAVVCSDVAGQRYVMDRSPGAGCTYVTGDYQALADALRNFARDANKLKACRDASLACAHHTWNWETESKTLLKSLHLTLGHP
jgi:glycosyltransferase involved in cell wall biosynthesis